MRTQESGKRVLIAGVPRSGTTWLGQVLGHVQDARYVHEPDNHLVRPEAWRAKRGLGSYPALRPGQDAPEYEHLWAAAFAGGPRPSLFGAGARIVHRLVPRAEKRALRKDASGFAANVARLAGTLAERQTEPQAAKTVIVKSVFCARSLEWLADRFAPSVVVIRRHPFAVVASWSDLGWSNFLDRDRGAVRDCVEVVGGPPPSPEASWIDRAAWHFGFLSSVLDRAIARHPEWWEVRHEMLCGDPEPGFRRLCLALGLEWTVAAEQFLAASNRPGRGYETNRLWAEQVDAGRSRLSLADQERVLEVLSAFSRGEVTTTPAPRRRDLLPVPALSGALVSGGL